MNNKNNTPVNDDNNKAINPSFNEKANEQKKNLFPIKIRRPIQKRNLPPIQSTIETNKSSYMDNTLQKDKGRKRPFYSRDAKREEKSYDSDTQIKQKVYKSEPISDKSVPIADESAENLKKEKMQKFFDDLLGEMERDANKITKKIPTGGLTPESNISLNNGESEVIHSNFKEPLEKAKMSIPKFNTFRLDKPIPDQARPKLDKAGAKGDKAGAKGYKPASKDDNSEQLDMKPVYGQLDIKSYTLRQSGLKSIANIDNRNYANLTTEHNTVEQSETGQVLTEQITPFLFTIKNKLTQIKQNSRVYNNFTNIQKHFIPSYKEWSHSIYGYNRETIKILPALDKAASKLIKGYFNLYDISKDKNARSKRARVKSRRHSYKRVITSKLSFKHTNNKVIIMAHVYNRRIKYLINNINAIPTADKMIVKNYYSFISAIKPKILILKTYIKLQSEIAFIRDFSKNPAKYAKILNKSKNLQKICENNKLVYKIFNSNVHLRKILNNDTKLKAIIFDTNLLNKILNAYGPLTDFINKRNLSTPLHWHQFLKKTVKRFFYKEMQSFTLRQINLIEKSKFNKSLLLPLINLLEIVFRKKIEFTFINTKYIYNSASILGESVANKLKNRKLKPLTVLNELFDMIKLPKKKNFILFGKMYYNKYSLQNMTLKDSKMNTLLLPTNYTEQAIVTNTESNLHNKPDTYISNILKLDALEQLICSANSKKGSTFQYGQSSYNIDNILRGLKYKFITGARVETAGRLTKRNTAERAINKSKYIGNLKNTDSSFKGLPATMIKGFEKSSVQYSFLSSKLRTGSYGVKSWVNAN